MSDPDWSVFSESKGAVGLDVGRMCSTAGTPHLNPICDFIEFRKSLIILANKERLDADPVLGHLVFLGLISAVEAYFRTILSRVSRACPYCRDHSSSLMVPLGAFDHYGSDDVSLGVLEHVSFATDGEIAKRTKALTGIDGISDQTELRSLLEVYGKLCQLRHVSVHARGILGSGAAKELGLDPGINRLNVDFQGVHEIAGVCASLVSVYNRVLIEKLTRRLQSKIATGVRKSNARRLAAEYMRLTWPYPFDSASPSIRKAFRQIADFLDQVPDKNLG